MGKKTREYIGRESRNEKKKPQIILSFELVTKLTANSLGPHVDDKKEEKKKPKKLSANERIISSCERNTLFSGFRF